MYVSIERYRGPSARRRVGRLGPLVPVIVLWAALLSSGCGEGGGAGEGSADLDPEQAEASVSDDSILFDSRLDFPEGVDQNLSLLDPLQDDWRSEVLHERAKKVLGLLFEKLVAGDSLDDSALLAPNFETGTRLREDKLETLYAREGITVRGFEAEGASGPRSALDQLLSSALVPFVKAADGRPAAHPHFKIISVDIEDDSSFETSVLVHIDGEGADGVLQQNMSWTVHWFAADAKEEVRIRSIRSRRFEEVVLLNPLFAEVTAHVFGALGSYREDFLQSVGAHRNRVDRLLGTPFLGMQGVALGDADGDGLDDLYVPFQAGVPNRLLMRKADGGVVDRSRKSLTNYLENTPSALLIDLDNDGDQDLVFGTDGGVGQARNDGSAIFGSPKLLPPSTVGEIYSLSAADPDLDGDLDVYVSRYGSGGILGAFPTPYHDANNGAANLYLENLGNRFVEKTEEVGLNENNQRFSLSSVWDDLDGDGQLDLYVANDFGRNNLYRNDDGHFQDMAAAFAAEDMAAGMGVSAADFDADGDTDLYITNMFSSAGLRIVPQTERFMDGANRDVHEHYKRHARGNTLLSNRGDGSFEDITDRAGVAVGGWGWGAGWLDFNNDGLQDIYSPNGFLTNRDPEDI